MKKRRNLIISRLLVAAIALGVGYAATDAILSVNGTATTKATNINVYFTEDSNITSATAVNDDQEGTRAAEIKKESSLQNFGSTDIIFYANNLSQVGDKVLATFYVKNDSAYAVTLDAPTIKSAADLENFKVTPSSTFTPVADGDFADGVLKAGGSVSFTVEVELLANNTAGTLTETFTVNVNASGVK